MDAVSTQPGSGNIGRRRLVISSGIDAELRALLDERGGRLTVDDVVEASRDPQSEMHPFIWYEGGQARETLARVCAGALLRRWERVSLRESVRQREQVVVPLQLKARVLIPNGIDVGYISRQDATAEELLMSTARRWRNIRGVLASMVNDTVGDAELHATLDRLTTEYVEAIDAVLGIDEGDDRQGSDA